MPSSFLKLFENPIMKTIPRFLRCAVVLLFSAICFVRPMATHAEWGYGESNIITVDTLGSVPTLEDGIVIQSAFPPSDTAQYYKITVMPGKNLKLRAINLSGTGSIELYASFNEVPTRAVYAYRSSLGTGTTGEILIPAATSGTWYVMACSPSNPPATNYSIQADLIGLDLGSVNPPKGGSQTGSTLTISGLGFSGVVQAALIGPGGTLFPATSVSVDSFTQITVSFAGGTVPAGSYDVKVTLPSGESKVLPGAFQVIGGGQPKLKTNLVVPNVVGYHQVATLYVEYSNEGDAAMPAPLLLVTARQLDREAAFLTLKNEGIVDGFWTSADPVGFTHSVQILASGKTPGVLQPGESMRVPVYYAGWQQPWDFSYPSINFRLGVLTADCAEPMDWTSIKPTMRPTAMDGATWDALWQGFMAQVGGDQWGDYIRMLDENANYLGRLGIRTVDIGELLAFALQKADGFSPLSSLANVEDAAVAAPGVPLSFGRSFSPSLAARSHTGRFGRGWADNWEYSLASGTDGTVTITGPGGSRRVFQPDSRRSGAYFNSIGDYGTLTALGNGAFKVTEKIGLKSVFRTDGKLDYVEDTHGIRVTCGYGGDLLTNLTHSTGPSLVLGYNGNRVASITDSLGRQTVLAYDAVGEHLVSRTNFRNETTRYAYVGGTSALTQHALTDIGYPDGVHQLYSYDAAGRLLTAAQSGSAGLVTFGYGVGGNVSATDALGNTSQYYFDQYGRIAKVEDALGRSLSKGFDVYGNLIRLTDAAGYSQTYGYDTKGNLTASTDALGNTNRFSYTASLNQLSKLMDANGNITTYTYQTTGDTASIIYADQSIERWSHNGSGNALTWTNRRGQTVSYTYDASGRVLSKTYADNSKVLYSYGARGNLLQAVDTTGTTSLTYDANDRLTKIEYPAERWLAYTYDAAGRRAQMMDQLGHQTNYEYDVAGRLASLTDENETRLVLYSYDAAGRLVREDKGNGTWTTHEYDAAGQVLHLVNFAPDGTVNSRFDYGYDLRGRRISMSTIDGSWAYGYDDIGQLTRAVFTSTNVAVQSQDLTYVYDAMGNRVSTIENGITKIYTTNGLNQYTKAGDTTFTYDADGNLIQESGTGGVTTYTYNQDNRLIGVSSTGNISAYTYDTFGNRTSVNENGQVTDYVIDPSGLGNVVGQYGVGGLEAGYTHGLGLVSQSTAATGRNYYEFEALGSTAGMTNAAGNMVSHCAYLPFGWKLHSTGVVPNRFEYVANQGIQIDSDRLFYMRLREYSPENGRFISADPCGIQSDFNPYRYCENSPLAYSDPSGLLSFEAGAKFSISVMKLLGHANNGLSYVNNTTESGIGRASSQLAGALLYDYVGSALGFAFGGPVGALAGGIIGGIIGEYIGETIYDDWNHPNLILFPKPPLPRPPLKVHVEINVFPTGSRDPNSLVGPSGYGPTGLITGSTVWPYTINFENDKSATAPAQQVVISNTLNSNLDIATLELTEAGFGDIRISIPSNTQYFEKTVTYMSNGKDYEVQFEASLNRATGILTASFRTIDPATGLPPPVDIGFLPPEDGTGRGMGFCSYTVRPKAGLASGTQIRNVAGISFDNQTVITTNQIDPHDATKGTDPTKECLLTVDAGIPSSRVAALPAEGPTSFSVRWSGSDGVGGSGIRSYTIYYSDDHGATYHPWLTNTLLTSGTFVGTAGKTYLFYSQAQDNAGNTEAMHSVADTGITSLAFTPGGASLVLTTNDPASGISRAKFSTVGNPAVDSIGNISFKAQVTGTGLSAANNTGIWFLSATTQALIARTGAGAPGTVGAIFATLSDPVTSGSGNVTFVGGLVIGRGDVKSAANAYGVWVRRSGRVSLFARSGVAAPDSVNALFASFDQVTVSEKGGIACLAKLTGSGVSTGNNIGLWGTDASGRLRLVLRKGDSLKANGVLRKVAAISAFQTGATVRGQSRSIDSKNAQLSFVAQFTDKTSAIVFAKPLKAGFQKEVVEETGSTTVPNVGSAKFIALGSPAVNEKGSVAFSGTIAGTVASARITSASNVGIWLDSGTSYRLVTRTGFVAPGSGNGVFASLGFPVINKNGCVAFTGGLKIGTGNTASAATAAGVWSNSRGTMQLVARSGAKAPGALGCFFSNFKEIVLPDVGGPVMLATLNGAAAGTSEGLWAQRADGSIRILARTGDIINVDGWPKRVKALKIFESPAVVGGQSRNFASGGRYIAFWAQFGDGSWGILEASL